MKIGILGVGHIGKTLTQQLSAAGHDVKVANSRGPDTIAADVLSSGARAVPADDEQDRQLGMALVEDTGFDAVDAGTLAESWRQQPGTPCYCTDLTSEEMPGALATADATRSPRRRDLAVAAIMERVGDGTT